jgi:hypothetical protein
MNRPRSQHPHIANASGDRPSTDGNPDGNPPSERRTPAPAEPPLTHGATCTGTRPLLLIRGPRSNSSLSLVKCQLGPPGPRQAPVHAQLTYGHALPWAHRGLAWRRRRCAVAERRTATTDVVRPVAGRCFSHPRAPIRRSSPRGVLARCRTDPRTTPVARSPEVIPRPRRREVTSRMSTHVTRVDDTCELLARQHARKAGLAPCPVASCLGPRDA